MGVPVKKTGKDSKAPKPDQPEPVRRAFAGPMRMPCIQIKAQFYFACNELDHGYGMYQPI